MEYKTEVKYGIFIINDSKYLKDGALKVELLNDQILSVCNSKQEAEHRILNGLFLNEGRYIILPIYNKTEIKNSF